MYRVDVDTGERTWANNALEFETEAEAENKRGQGQLDRHPGAQRDLMAKAV